MFALKLLLAIATIGVALPAQAAPAPIVFDFEDGLQGWELGGAAQRVQTQVLGGEWAIFGDGQVGARASMSIEMDLTDIASISVEQFLIAGDEDGLRSLRFTEIIGHTIIVHLESFDVIESGNPSVRALDVSSLTGVRPIEFIWGFGSGTEPPLRIVAFIDNITFHPVPEPGTLGLLAGSLAALVIARRRMM